MIRTQRLAFSFSFFQSQKHKLFLHIYVKKKEGFWTTITKMVWGGEMGRGGLPGFHDYIPLNSQKQLLALNVTVSMLVIYRKCQNLQANWGDLT